MFAMDTFIYKLWSNIYAKMLSFWENRQKPFLWTQLAKNLPQQKKIKRGFKSKFNPEISHFLSINLISNPQQT